MSFELLLLNKKSFVENQLLPGTMESANVRGEEHRPGLRIGMDPFVYRQFDDTSSSAGKIPYEKNAFLAKVKEEYQCNRLQLFAGYASFCKHMFIPNFTEATPACIELTEETQDFVQTGYQARRPEELPVLCRWIEKEAVQHLLRPASYLDVILYSREQVQKENAAMGTDSNPLMEDYYIVSIKAQSVAYELPMSPITMMRNALIREGGSGVPIDRQKYHESVAFWEKHCELK